MRPAAVQRETLAVSVVLAAAILTVAIFAGYVGVGVAVGLGLVVGAFNGFVIRVLLDRRAPILPTSFLRLMMLSLVALAAARLLGSGVWPVVAGLALAQLVMVGVSVRQGLQA